MWEAIEGRFVLEPHERLLLEQAARTADLITTMQAEVDHDGVQLPWGQDGQTRAHPLIGQLAQHRALLARTLAALHIPEVDADAIGAPRDRRGPFRGYYAVRGRA